MTNRVTVLLEKALNSSSDPERLACLNQLKKVYRGTGIAQPDTPQPNAPRPERVVSTGDASELRRVQQELAAATTLAAKFQHQRDQLRQENDDLKVDMLKAQLPVDDGKDTQIYHLFLANCIGWGAAIALGITVIMLAL